MLEYDLVASTTSNAMYMHKSVSEVDGVNPKPNKLFDSLTPLTC